MKQDENSYTCPRYGYVIPKKEAKVSVNFVLNVLRQHENDLDRSIAEIELIKQKLEKLTSKVQQILDNFHSETKL